jgi:signal transduction histidine kinase
MDDRPQLKTTLDALSSPDWPSRVDALVAIRKMLGDGCSTETLREVQPRLMQLLDDQSWKVRQALVGALAMLPRNPDSDRALVQLAEDPNRYVREAATRAQATDRAGPSGWRKTVDKDDPLLQAIWTEIRRVAPSSLSETALYQGAQRIADAAYRAVAADATHELNTVLSAVDGFADEIGRRLAEERGKDPDLTVLFERLRERTGLARRIVQNLRYYSAPADGPVEEVEAAALLREAAELSQHSVSRKLPLPTLRFADMAASRVSVVKDRMVCALTNVICNALEACTPDGAVTVGIQAGLESVVFSVEDNGCGMEDSQLADATKRFTTNKRELGGTGMGLAIAQHVIEEEHGGRLELQSVAGQGTTVVIVLPAAEGSEGGGAA